MTMVKQVLFTFSTSFRFGEVPVDQQNVAPSSPPIPVDVLHTLSIEPKPRLDYVVFG